MSSCKLLLVLVTCVVAALSLNPAGWLDRVVQYQKIKFYNELEKFAPINIHATLRAKPPGYVDSQEWDFDSVVRLLTLIRGSENAKPVRNALRRMLQPTRRIMMSMKESMHRFPSIKLDNNNFYYDVEYTDDEELPSPPPLPEDEMVVYISNPVEARLPSGKISVKLLKEIMEARARAAKQMPTTKPPTIPWKPMNTTNVILGYIGEKKEGGEASGTATTPGESGGESGGDGKTENSEGGGGSETTQEEAAATTEEAEPN